MRGTQGGVSWRAIVPGLVVGLTGVTAQGPGRIVREAEALGVRTGVCVVDLATGRVAFERRADEAFIPASNQKVLTAIGALHGLRQRPEFQTDFRLRGDVLEVVAGGDPNFCVDGGNDPVEVFADVARALRQRGVTALRGVRVAAGPFVGPGRPSGWPRDQRAYDYCAPTAGVVVERGCFRVTIASSRGSSATLTPAAATPLPIRGSIGMTRDRRKGSRYGLIDLGGTLRASGHFLRGARPVTVAGAVRDPQAVFVRALVDTLRDVGVAVASDEVLSVGGEGQPVVDVFEHRSSLAMALGPMLAESSNFHAEQVFRVLGARTHGLATFPSSARALRSHLAELVGRVPEAVKIVDGSGLSRGNRVTPRFLATALQCALRDAAAEELRDHLPGAGEGTLKRRFADSPVADRVRAKTGWIRGASALTGVVGDRAFAILMNYEPSRGGLNKTLKRLQERIVEAVSEAE